VAEGTIANWRQWPKPAQLCVGLIGGAAGLATAYALLAGTPKPVLPSSALFEPVSVEQTLSASRPELSSFDFIFRPVFALDREPPVQPELPLEDDAALAAAEAEAVVVESIDGVNLLGIFGSGEVAGVIIRLDNGERQRLVVGESIKGWTLDSVGSRRAHLRASTGEEARLEMIFATDQSPITVKMKGVADSGPLEGSEAAGSAGGHKDGPEQSAGREAAPARLSFESFYGGPPQQDATTGQKEND